MANRLQHVQSRISSSVSARLRLYFGTGLLLLLPVAVTFFILKLVFDFLDGLLQPVFRWTIGGEVPGAGLVALVLLVLLVGFVGSGRIGSRVIGLVQAFLLRVPLIRSVYSASTQLIDIFSGNRASDDAKRVVLIEYPRAGSWAVGFLMAATTDESGRAMGIVYIPTAPVPNSGWVAVVPMSDVYETDLTVQQATQFVLSGGVLTPSHLLKRPLQQRLVDSLRAELEAHQAELEARRRELEELQARVQQPSLAPPEETQQQEQVSPSPVAVASPEPERRRWWDRWRR